MSCFVADCCHCHCCNRCNGVVKEETSWYARTSRAFQRVFFTASQFSAIVTIKNNDIAFIVTKNVNRGCFLLFLPQINCCVYSSFPCWWLFSVFYIKVIECCLRRLGFSRLYNFAPIFDKKILFFQRVKLIGNCSD